MPKPISPVGAVTTAGRSLPLVNAFLGGFAVGEAGLSLYGYVTGTNPLNGVCNQAQWLQTTSSILYVGMMPDCTAQVQLPNADQTTQLGVLSYAGFSATYGGAVLPGGYSYRLYCYSTTGTLPAGYAVQFVTHAGGTGSTSLTATDTKCVSGYQKYIAGWITGASTGLADSPALSVAQTSTGQKVAEMTQTTPNPTRSTSCTITWDDATQTTKAGVTYQDSTGVPLTAEKLGCKDAWNARPNGKIPTKISVDENDGTTSKSLIQQDIKPGSIPPEVITPTTQGGGLVLYKVVGTQLDSCMTWATSCAGWWSQSSNGANEDTYRCQYNGKAVALTQCSPYQQTFETKTDKPTITNPADGTSIDWGGDPDPNSTDPATGPTPGEQCMAQWSSVSNPVEWVLQPVKCALVWAFVPRAQKVQDSQEGVEDTWKASRPGKLAEAVGALTAPLTALGAGSCGGMVLPVPTVGAGFSVTTQNRAFLAACPGDFFAPWASGFYWLISAGVVFYGVFGIKRLLDRFVGNS